MWIADDKFCKYIGVVKLFVTILVMFLIHSSYTCYTTANVEDWKPFLQLQIYITLYDSIILFQTLFYSRP